MDNRVHGIASLGVSWTRQKNTTLIWLQDESKIYVESEDSPERLLLETKITKDDGYQKQQGERAWRLTWNVNGCSKVDADTLIVWTETSGIDMALSFQEAEGCATIWLVTCPSQTIHRR